MIVDETLLDGLIESGSRAIRYYVIFTVSLVALGALVLIVANLLSDKLIPELLKQLLSMGAIFSSALGALPIKEIMKRKEKIGMLETIKTQIDKLEEAGEAVDADARKRIDSLVWKVVEKTALG